MFTSIRGPECPCIRWNTLSISVQCLIRRNSILLNARYKTNSIFYGLLLRCKPGGFQTTYTNKQEFAPECWKNCRTVGRCDPKLMRDKAPAGRICIINYENGIRKYLKLYNLFALPGKIIKAGHSDGNSSKVVHTWLLSRCMFTTRRKGYGLSLIHI